MTQLVSTAQGIKAITLQIPENHSGASRETPMAVTKQLCAVLGIQAERAGTVSAKAFRGFANCYHHFSKRVEACAKGDG